APLLDRLQIHHRRLFSASAFGPALAVDHRIGSSAANLVAHRSSVASTLHSDLDLRALISHHQRPQPHHLFQPHSLSPSRRIRHRRSSHLQIRYPGHHPLPLHPVVSQVRLFPAEPRPVSLPFQRRTVLLHQRVQSLPPSSV